MKKAGEFPGHCECGGLIKYERAFGRVFSYCMRCTPVEEIKVYRNPPLPAPTKGE